MDNQNLTKLTLKKKIKNNEHLKTSEYVRQLIFRSTRSNTYKCMS